MRAMKNLLLFSAALLGSLSVNAQTRVFKPFKVDASVGFSVPQAFIVGPLLAMEPKYALNDQFALGLRIESVNSYRDLSGNTTTDAYYIRSYGLSGDYYFSKARRRVFAGLVAGLYQYATATVNIDKLRPLSPVQFGPAQLGFAPRVGAELGHFRLGSEYNFTFGTQSRSTSYFSLKAGIVIGGGQYAR